jgi:hypothetical protein
VHRTDRPCYHADPAKRDPLAPEDHARVAADPRWERERAAKPGASAEYLRGVEDLRRAVWASWVEEMDTTHQSSWHQGIHAVITAMDVECGKFRSLYAAPLADATRPAPSITPEIRARMDDDRAKAEAAMPRDPSRPPAYWFADDSNGNPCFWWRNPFSDQPETLGRFMWPSHPVEWDVDGWWETLTTSIVAAVNAKPAPKGDAREGRTG